MTKRGYFVIQIKILKFEKIPPESPFIKGEKSGSQNYFLSK
jgi:hypothetical protein